MITHPGIYAGIDETVYHADSDLAPELGRSLSQSGAKTLLASPARFAWERDHGRPPKDAYDLGTLVHALVLRSRDDRIRVIDARDWKTKRAQEARDEARAAGMVPVLRSQLLDASRVARAVRRHPLAGAMFRGGRAEVSLYWIDDETGVTCRGRIDYVHPGGLVDLKTTTYGRGDLDVFGRSAASYDYPMQAAVYSDGWEALTGVRLPFVTVVVEVDPPYMITVGQYDDEDLDAGRARWRTALSVYAERESSGVWDDPLTDIPTIPVPAWYARSA